MIRLDHKHVGPVERVDATARLDFAARQRGGQRLACDTGEIVEFNMADGAVLADGDILTDARQRFFVRIVATAEVLSYVHCADKMVLNRICYHLGRRGVALQIHADAIAYRHDPELDALVARFGRPPQICHCSFYPEPVSFEAPTRVAPVEGEVKRGSNAASFTSELRQAGFAS